MKTHKQVYIAIDLHSKTSMVGYMNEQGEYLHQRQVATTAQNLINEVVAISAERKSLTIEQSNMTFWAADQLRSYVDELIVCDPRHNALISRSESKNDRLDTMRLCKLLRMGELKAVWLPRQMGSRRVFYGQVKEYQRLIKTLSIHKRQLGDQLRHWGITRKPVAGDYRDPKVLLGGIGQDLVRGEVAAKITFIQQIEHAKNEQKKRMIQTGGLFWEIAEFLRIPGIGPIGAHMFSGYIQTPHRFRRSRQLIQFCQLGVRSFTSDGKRVRRERLSKAGHGCLKNLAHIAWKSSMSSDNEVSRYYQGQLENSGNEVHARLSTQRKILRVMWGLWKSHRPYDPDAFTYIHGDSDR